MALAPGVRLGPYEIAAQIGVGGMGEVYRARDTKLSASVHRTRRLAWSVESWTRRSSPGAEDRGQRHSQPDRVRVRALHGHADLRTMMIYAHVSVGTRRLAAPRHHDS